MEECVIYIKMHILLIKKNSINELNNTFPSQASVKKTVQGVEHTDYLIKKRFQAQWSIKKGHANNLLGLRTIDFIEKGAAEPPITNS